ncbi:HutD/Ves family protein [Gallaecimonas mangrovi]|uniref:HutD/Ves family protein n=1 Tax=Gallaecimonas mangrovi TaxID=2291597 RepID=UPI001868B91D|nr:HutD family protein [Gallaecimonas mangrovi]
MSVTFCLLEQSAVQPWKNGGGLTRQLLAFPEDNWALRVSVADINVAGPFSVFSGVQRNFVLLSGQSITLTGAGKSQQLTPKSPPLSFDGADNAYCQLEAGSVQALNFMVKSAAGVGSMQRVTANQPWQGSFTWRAVFSVNGGLLQAGGERLKLPAMSLAWSLDSGAIPWHFGSDGEAFWLGFQEKA